MQLKENVLEDKDLKENKNLENSSNLDNNEILLNQNSNKIQNNQIIENNSIENKLKNKIANLSVLKIYGILIAIFLVIVLISFFIFSFINSKNENIFSGIFIKNINVSNLSKENAISKVNETLKNYLPEEIILKHNDFETSINTQDLNINFDVQSAVDSAYGIGRSGNFISDNFEILSNVFFNKNVEPTMQFDKQALKNILKDISSKLPDKVIESGYYIEDNNLIINKGQTGKAINIDEMANYIEQEIKNLNIKNNKLEIITKTANPSAIDIDAVYSEVHKDPVDASFSQNPLSITPSENGVDFNISLDEAKSLLNEEGTETVIPLKVVYPNVTTNMIGTEAFPDLLSNFSTNYSTRDTNRTTNLILASNKINGTVIMPGEVFSYNKVVGERTIAAGYKEAPIYVSGRVEDGLGGGICQITTTLYNAVVYANLEIVERSNHQFVPSYVGAGRDATVVYGAIDFKFKNNRNYPIKLVCSVSGGVANFQILGLKTQDDYDVDISARVTSQTSNSTNSETYKILKKNGVVVDRILLSRDTYKRH